MMRPPGAAQPGKRMARTSVAPSRQYHLKSHIHTQAVSIVCMSEASIETDGTDAFVVYHGVRIAKRGQPNTPQAGTWVSLEPRFRVQPSCASQLARRIAANIAKPPELLGKAK